SDFMENFHKNNQTMDQINRDIAKRQYEKESRQQLHENPILAIRPIIENQIRSFEASLEEKSFVGAWLASFGSQKLIFVENIQLEEPCLIIFHGKDENGAPLSLIQHVSQLNFLLQACQLERDTPRTPIGFIHT
ncbi:TPA: hypothetical protein NU719_003688, partial [Acinetobacter baumannii]|nr:hypothetical protein [Acinetobacter baumannii]HCJ7895636.1 hypothetical protein [Acinetobacter baumannii]